MELVAKLSSVYLEEAFAKLTKDLNSKPYLRVQVVLIDNTDAHNGFASPVPQNTIYIYTVPPLSHSSIGEYDNWLRNTIFHELTHIINLSTTRGYSKILRPVFGTIVSINGLSPLNIIEGYAVFEETKMSNKGRGRSSYLHTMMRTMAYENTLSSNNMLRLSQTPFILDRWPYGNVPYLYGFLLMEHVALRYGDDLPGKISKHNAGVIPYYPSYSFIKYTGKDIPELWDEIIIDKNTLYKKWIEHIENSPVTKVERISDEGFINRAPALSPDGKHLAYYVINPDKKNRIAIIDTETNKEINFVRVKNDSYFVKWLDNQNIIFNEHRGEVVGSSYYTLRTFNITTDHSNIITNSYRIIDASPINPKNLCTVRARTAKMEINIESLEKHHLKKIKTLYESQYLARISSPVCIIKDGDIEVLFIEKNVDKKEALIRFSGGKKQNLYESNGSIADFILVGGKIIISDDKDRVFNLYELDLSKNKTKKLTNLITGAFDIENTIKKDGKDLYITYYTSKGFRIGRINIEGLHCEHSNNECKNKTTAENETYFSPDELAITDSPKMINPESKTSSYSSLKTLVPKLWMPSFEFVDGGFTAGGMTYGADSLFRHQYFVSALYDSRTKSPLISAVYTNQSFYPTFSISAYNDNTWYSDSEIIKNLSSNIDVSIPIRNRWYLITGLTYNYRMLDYLGVRTKRLGLYGGVSYNNTYSTISAISVPEQGVSGFLKYTLYPKFMDSTYNEYEITSNLRFFIPMPWNGHVIAMNNNLAYSYGNPYMFFVAGGEQSSLIFYSKRFLMRGYPVSYFGTRSLIVSNIEYRFPIVTIHRGHGMFPIFFKKIHGAIVSDHGFMGKDLKRDFHSYGFEIRTDGQIFYHIPVTLRIGLYKATDYPRGQFFIGVSSTF
jgi:hypothetical protein